MIRYEVEDTSRSALEDRWAGRRQDPRFNSLEEAIRFAVHDLDRWTDGSGHYVINQVEVIEERGPEDWCRLNADGTFDVVDLTPIVGFVCCDRTREYGDMVYLGVDGTVKITQPIISQDHLPKSPRRPGDPIATPAGESW